ncbi:hypothetical protein PR202_ga05651 [Eleusine coracana subsp. coracana]|uniref:Dof-type domain-containing protein n=1 Tax=Eleusine coracana subsp. coracana TaxID=191504 RepID=A0AAV5BU30_ELECO|nr:hypothetical protein QOZ80_5AG0366820 [Eleusine coracana subsp. coracana]GJM89055.1 hypothetical protein PR202_ga05197 [Eleusine coracana subsp. coracana]GJM89456.1 hypothetical protein PR202_ga05651 [Eleusine coracana subsp. coracana]
MLSHIEATPCTGAAAGIKLFGKVITAQHNQQPVRRAVANANAAAAPARRGGSVDLLEEEARARAAAAEARLPCPRCRSQDTKFCYFNNYNVKQPRHFCRACHRYWTAGGAIRNVPVGSGRRKNRAMVMPSSSSSSAPHHAATSSSGSDDQRSGSGSPPVLGAPSPGFFPPYYHDPSSSIAASPGYNAGGRLPETMWHCWWLVTSTAESSVGLDRAF